MYLKLKTLIGYNDPYSPDSNKQTYHLNNHYQLNSLTGSRKYMIKDVAFRYPEDWETFDSFTKSLHIHENNIDHLINMYSNFLLAENYAGISQLTTMTREYRKGLFLFDSSTNYSLCQKQ